MISLFNDIVNEVSRSIWGDLNSGRNVQKLLDAYNYWQEQECDGVNYIFDINNKDDVKHLVNNDSLTAIDIVWIMGAKEDLFIFTDAGIELISYEKAIDIIKKNTESILQCMFLYVARCGSNSPYSEIYEEYITQILEKEGFFQR